MHTLKGSNIASDLQLIQTLLSPYHYYKKTEIYGFSDFIQEGYIWAILKN